MQEQLKQRYLQLRLDRNGGRIDEQTFINEVSQLRFQDNSDNWWQIEPQSGQWLIWDGSNWAQPTSEQKLNMIKPPTHAAAEQTNQSSDRNQSQNDRKKLKESGRTGENRKEHNNQKLPERSTSSNSAAGQNITSAEAISPAQLQGMISIDFKSLLSQIGRNTFSRYRIMITAGIIAFLLHTFLIAVGNDGFNKDSQISSMFSQLSSYYPSIFGSSLPWYIDYTIGNFKVGSNVAIIGNETNATLGWLLGGAMVLGAWRAFLSNGPLGTLRRITGLPRQVAASCSPHLGLNLGAIFVGAWLARFFSDQMPHQAQNMTSFISLGLVGSIIPLALSSYVSRIGLHFADTLKMPFLRKVSYTGMTQLAFLGISAGMFSKSCWQYGPALGWGLALYTAYLVVTRSNQTLPVSAQVSSFLSFVALTGALLFVAEEAVYAHDKGWWENVNPNDPITQQITSWINAGGSKEIMQAGIPPAIGAAIGAGAVDAASVVTTYVLQVSSYHLTVSPEQPDDLLIAVWKSVNGGPLVPAGDASISLSAGGSNWLTLSNTSGSCRLSCVVGQAATSVSGSTMLQPSTIYVTGSGGGQSCSATVAVTPGGMPAYVLEVF